jgi:uncharacterized protein YbaR (Trm112 family)
MFIEFVESLRCPVPHEESWLVAAADRMRGRTIVGGLLGCPVCGARYPIEDGVTYLGALPSAPPDDPAPPPPQDDELLRAAALLALVEPGGTAALVGTWARLRSGLRALAEVHLLLVDPPFAVSSEEGASVVRTAGALPLAAGSVRGGALDLAAARRPAVLAGAVEALRPRGGGVAPVATPLPRGVTAVARDEREWVAEREAPVRSPVIVPLGRAGTRRHGGGG